MLCSILCRTVESETEALQTAGSPLWLIFHTLYCREPFVMVIVIVHDFQTERFRIPAAFVFPDQIFLLWVNIWIAIKNRRDDATAHQAFYDGRTARGTAGV